ncbi:hypothetical protein [Candidatus Palauibacter sp.]|uniref:hypothetical protein n=1 Tax=Candidatus Palauibacter sp. TaxID=3101350 RepID=UPI003CC657B5
MEAPGLNAVELLQEVIREHSPEDIWQGSPLIGYRMLANTNRGAIGEEFIRRYLAAAEIEAGNGGRVSRTDLRVGETKFEVKTASLGANGTFQFNHVRMDRDYDYLLCLGICPDRVVFNMWRKGVVAENRAGRLVRMAEGQAVTYKLTKETGRHAGHRSPTGSNPCRSSGYPLSLLQDTILTSASSRVEPMGAFTSPRSRFVVFWPSSFGTSC